MTLFPQIDLNLTRAHIVRVEEQHPVPTEQSEALLTVLKIYERSRCLEVEDKQPDYRHLMMCLQGIRLAKRFVADAADSKNREAFQLLSFIVLAFAKIIRAQEQTYPELKFFLDRECAAYRIALEAARQTELKEQRPTIN